MVNIWSKYPDFNHEIDKVENLLRETLRSRRKIIDETTMDLLGVSNKCLSLPIYYIKQIGGGYLCTNQ